MTIFNFLTLIGGLAMFLFGMDVMGKSLEKMGGSKLGAILEKMTDSRIKGVLLGLFVTAVIQSSSYVVLGCFCSGRGCNSISIFLWHCLCVALFYVDVFN